MDRPLHTNLDSHVSIQPIPDLAADIEALGLKVSKGVRQLQDDSYKLGMIRATLMVNYVTGRKIDGIEVVDQPDTLNMLLDVLRAYHAKCNDVQDAPSRPVSAGL